MSRVAIIGSCITRDLWPVQGEALREVLYVSRTSLPSLLSPATPGFVPHEAPPGGLKRHQHNAVVADLRKSALRALLAHEPTHIIFDFIDERFDLLNTGAGFATHSWELEVSGYLSQPALAGSAPLPRLSEGSDRLWIEAAGEMLALIRATPLRRARLILHEAQWATHERPAPRRGAKPLAEVELWGGRTAEIERHNMMLARYQAAFMALAPEADKVAASNLRIADASHRWGLSAFHYVPEYYEEIWRQLRNLGV